MKEEVNALTASQLGRRIIQLLALWQVAEGLAARSDAGEDDIVRGLLEAREGSEETSQK